MFRAITLSLVLVSGTVVAQGAKPPIPEPASRLVAAVHDAANSGKPDALRKFMAPDFVSSFGPDSGPNEAIALWSDDPSSLAHLARITGAACEFQPPDYVECPPNAGMGYRAGFKLIDGQWVFFAFVAGD